MPPKAALAPKQPNLLVPAVASTAVAAPAVAPPTVAPPAVAPPAVAQLPLQQLPLQLVSVGLGGCRNSMSNLGTLGITVQCSPHVEKYALCSLRICCTDKTKETLQLNTYKERQAAYATFKRPASCPESAA